MNPAIAGSKYSLLLLQPTWRTGRAWALQTETQAGSLASSSDPKSSKSLCYLFLLFVLYTYLLFFFTRLSLFSFQHLMFFLLLSPLLFLLTPRKFLPFRVVTVSLIKTLVINAKWLTGYKQGTSQI